MLEKMVIGLGFDAGKTSQVEETALEMVAKGIDQDDFIETYKI